MKSISSEKCSNSTSLYPYRAKSCLIYFCCYIFFPMSMGFLSFFHAYFKHISAYFSSTKPDFDDTSPHFMILWWYFSLHFLEKSLFAKVLNINDIILYLSRKMILWDFFRKKLFCVSIFDVAIYRLVDRIVLVLLPHFDGFDIFFCKKTKII